MTGRTDGCRVVLMNSATNTVIDLGNNEQASIGVFPNGDGTYTALTMSKSKSFKTKGGACRWLTRLTGKQW